MKINLSSKKIQTIQENILSRYQENGRKFPRRMTTDPYAIHMCEVMSQQTQVDRVLPYWQKRMQDIPDYQVLAKISKLDLLAHWSGLGFNSRAMRLQDCAKIVIDNYNGELPKSREALLSLPGIGPYTAGAICAFAWNMDEVVIDTNIRRVLIFLLKLDENITIKQLEATAKMMIPSGHSRDWHNALMDYGATHLTARKTKIKSKGKQSKFEGSDRQVRGRILKQLVKSEQNNQLTLQIIQEEFPQKDSPTLEKIITQMVEEKLIIQEKEMLKISG
ncbi:MAG: Fe-S cluster assembly protein HesB [candidate division SR1 bacterium]|nr:MAG: Fe-S cluster assembly protein HesB [candidate division SR1 bacterium]